MNRLRSEVSRASGGDGSRAGDADAGSTSSYFGGVHVIGTRNVFINLTGGYLFPTERLDDLAGWRVKAGVDFSLW